ncbi:GEVED domain-containing protein [Psychroflexus montanilacus]|uniref:GEVED domain-containing protein n=1 Tax=Psychroflexus montanilacus TaxID=2873598 RepID=UPI001CCAFE21|nr:GEVED domain-containing protein [Psychroflexus montanilacus]MBZ9651251.1 GEVED domain-containing protein [Psychroflexus montanilacus]
MRKITLLMTCVFLFSTAFESTAQERSINELIQSYEINKNSPNNYTQFFTIEEMKKLNAYLKDQTTPEVINQNLKNGVLAYGWESQANGYGSYDISSPNDYTTISGGAPIADGDFEGAGAIDPFNNTTGYTADNVGNLYALDVLTGTYTPAGNTGLATGFTGLAYNPEDGVLYGVDSNNLYLVDPDTADATLIGSLGLPGNDANPTGIAIALAIDGSETAYTYDIVLDIAYSIDLSTGATTALGPIGFDASFGQGMFYDQASDQVYLAAFNVVGNLSELRILDTTTGGTTLVGEISPGAVTQVGWSSVQNAPPLEFPLPYCGPIEFSSGVEPISNVEFAGIENRSDASVGGSPGHENFTSISGDVLAGESYEIALEGNTDGASFTNRFVVFIDWNQNDILDDEGEVYEITETIQGSTGEDGQQAVQLLEVPIDALEGQTRMRIKKIFGTTNYLDPCLGTTFGQAEDYSINVTTPVARAQVVHNSPDPSAEFVDVYLGSTLLLDDFEFRTSTPFVDVPANQEITLSVAPGTSTDVSEALYSVDVTLVDGETYIVVADGVLDPSQFDDSVNAIDFALQVFAGGREAAATSGNTDVLVHHGAPDAPTVDVVNQADGNVLVDDISYPEFQGYLELPTDDYLIDVTTADNSTKVAGYQAYLADLGLDDAAITVFASGFLDPSVNQDGPAFGLWVSLASGGPLVELNDEDFVPFPAPYCGPLDYGSVEPITNVEFGGIENRSDASLGGSPAHEDFTEISSDVLIQEESYDIILEGNTGGSFENAFVVFIDWNQDGVFDGEDEVIEIIQTIDNSNGEDGQQAIQSIEVPANALNGETRMRIKKFFFVNDLPSDYLDPCVTSSTFGQAEDYTLNVGTLSNDNFDSKDFSYYPNPVKDVLSISTASTVENIKVYNMLGQMVKETAPKSANPQINLSEFNSGVYLVSLEVEGRVETFRVIKQ